MTTCREYPASRSDDDDDLNMADRVEVDGGVDVLNWWQSDGCRSRKGVS